MNKKRVEPASPSGLNVRVLDARGLTCPLPLLKMKLELKKLKIGEQLQVLASDQASLHDFESYCALSRHRLLFAEQKQSDIIFLIEKG